MLTANPLIALLNPDEPPTTSEDFDSIWQQYGRPNRYSYRDHTRTTKAFPFFASLVLSATGETVLRCNDCQSAHIQDDSTDYHGEPICEACAEDYYSCEDCGYLMHSDDSRWLDGLDRCVCESCSESYYWCDNCETYDTQECQGCNDGCECCSPHQTFRFPANGAGTIQNDTRLSVELPKGVISKAGLVAILAAVTDTLPTAEPMRQAAENYSHSGGTWGAYAEARDAHEANVRTASKALDTVGDEWQTKRGNFPKRLASALHKVGIKIPPATISEVGNLARQYSDDTSAYHVEFTRDLNQSADYFYHEDSCWWQSYSNSRCALKNWGGLAMRTFDSEDSDQDDPSGRVFVFPLNKDFEPTQNAETAHAYMVFNAYGSLSGYSSARIIAHLAGKTYRKVSFDLDISDGYVNSSAGYLVCSPDSIGDAPDSFSFSHDSHKVTA